MQNFLFSTQLFTDLNFYWSRDYFPNFIEEDRRTFVSNDGHMYISALERIDAGNYSCNVQTNVSATGKNGPFFRLNVLPHRKSSLCSVLK